MVPWKLSPDLAFEAGHVMLRHFDGLSHEQIGERMNRTTAASRMLWIRALESLKKTYGD
jgi:DNA-directed RNA polymerase specialized sigma24 family protein